IVSMLKWVDLPVAAIGCHRPSSVCRRRWVCGVMDSGLLGRHDWWLRIEQTKPRLGFASVNPTNEAKDAQSLPIIATVHSLGLRGRKDSGNHETNPKSKWIGYNV